MIPRPIVESIASHLFSEEDTNVFAVLDGASVPDLQDRLYELQPEYECLYTGELEPDMAEVAPYLVHLDGAEFTNWVLEKGWGNHWGIFSVTAVDLGALKRHLRTLLTVYDTTGKPMLFRFYDPRVWRVFLPTCTANELDTAFGPVDRYMVEDEEPAGLISFRRERGSLERRKVSLATE
jgi:hypothetical protein